MNDSETTNASSLRRRSHGALWLIGIALLMNAAVMAWPRGQQSPAFSGGTLRAAFGAPVTSGHDNYILPLRLGDKSWGLVLVDQRKKVFCVYRFLESASRLRLVAARDYRFDLLLHDYNNTSPTPAQVKAMVSLLRPPAHHEKLPEKGNPAKK